jgi:exopolyphosphatase/guanosine-5'-triphosphate,3'-diphosphate pyrophosphatase
VDARRLRGQRIVTIVAAIDCGTNAIRLLVCDVAADRPMHELTRVMRIVRLGEGVDRTGEFSAEALERTFVAIDEYAGLVRALGVERIRFVATSASRDVSNRAAFVHGVRSRLGIDPEVISGTEEAALSFDGAVRGLPAGVAELPALVVDIGGGSTEFVLGSSAPDRAVSVDIGCVRMTERHLFSDPPTSGELAAAATDIDAAVRYALDQVDPTSARCLVGLAGTVTTVSAMAMDLSEYDAAVLHGSAISLAEVEAATARLAAMTRAQRAALPYMHPGRVDVIAGGAMILRSIMRTGGFPQVLVSETDILDGIVYRLTPESV